MSSPTYEELLAQVAQLREDLQEYGSHGPACMAGYYEDRPTGLEPYIPKGPCDCGLSAALAATQQNQGGEVSQEQHASSEPRASSSPPQLSEAQIRTAQQLTALTVPVPPDPPGLLDPDFPLQEPKR